MKPTKVIELIHPNQQTKELFDQVSSSSEEVLVKQFDSVETILMNPDVYDKFKERHKEILKPNEEAMRPLCQLTKSSKNTSKKPLRGQINSIGVSHENEFVDQDSKLFKDNASVETDSSSREEYCAGCFVEDQDINIKVSDDGTCNDLGLDFEQKIKAEDSADIKNDLDSEEDPADHRTYQPIKIPENAKKVKIAITSYFYGHETWDENLHNDYISKKLYKTSVKYKV